MARDTSRPSIKDEDVYDALREKGDSKEKAARIANAKARGTTDRSRSLLRSQPQSRNFRKLCRAYICYRLVAVGWL